MHRWYSCRSSEQCHVVASTSALHSQLTVINKRYSYFKQTAQTTFTGDGS